MYGHSVLMTEFHFKVIHTIGVVSAIFSDLCQGSSSAFGAKLRKVASGGRDTLVNFLKKYLASALIEYFVALPAVVVIEGEKL